MSENVAKSAYRLVNPLITSWTEAYIYLSPILGEPEDILFDEDGINYLTYPDHDVSVNDTRLVIDQIINKTYGCGDDLCLDLSQINLDFEILSNKFNVDIENIYLVSYTYYNGVEDPIVSFSK